MSNAVQPQSPAARQVSEVASGAAGSSPRQYRLPRGFLKPCGHPESRGITSAAKGGDAGCTVTLCDFR
jgi:hypothetical protein